MQQTLKFNSDIARALSLCAIAIWSVATAGAQTPSSPAPGYAVVEGIAVDSLHADFLRGAVLMVEGATVTATTDSLGRFRLDSVPPGVHRITVVHPVLDSVGITLVTAPLQLAAGQNMRLMVSTPSARTVVNTRCSSAERIVGPHALMGVVHYAESEAPAVGAKVWLEWIEYESGGNALRTTPRRRVATVAENGRFRICALPGNFTATLTGSNGPDTTASVTIDLNSLLSVAGLDLAEPEVPQPATAGLPVAAGNAAVATSRRGIVTGRVFDAAGVPISRVRVSVNGDSAFAMSGTDGRFVLRNVRPGTRSVTARRLGFAPTEQVVAIRSTNPADVTIRLGAFVPVLDTVRITAPAAQIGLERVGFARRKTIGNGYFLTPDDIRDRHAFDITDLLTMAPMLRRTTVNGRQVITGRPQGISNGCVTYFVDGAPWMGGGIEDFVLPAEVAAIEVYSTGFTPAQFLSPIQGCETVAIWTKMRVGAR